VNIFPYNLMVFAFLRQYYLYEHHNTANDFLRATFTSVCNRRFSSSPETLQKIPHYFLDN